MSRFCRVGCLAIILSIAIAPLFSQTNSKLKSESAESRTGVINTSICDVLEHPGKFNGKTVKIHAKYSGTWEGSWLSDPECPDRVGELDDAQEVQPDAERRKFNSAAQKLYTGMGYVDKAGKIHNGQYDYITADFSGVLVIKRNFHVKKNAYGNVAFGNGWGHLGLSRFRLVLTSVSNVSPHRCACPPEDDEPPPILFRVPNDAISEQIPAAHTLSSDQQLVINAWLRANPNYRLATDADCECDAEIAAIRHGDGGKWKPVPDFHPFQVTGDFNGDGNKDFAVAVIDGTKWGKSFSLLVFNGLFGSSKYLPAYVESDIAMEGTGMFYGPPRPKPYRLVIGRFDSEGSILVPNGNTYRYEFPSSEDE